MAPRARSIVAAGHPATAEAALALLDGGGNAFDAAVAAGFAAAVCEPGFTSLGGGGFLLARTEHRPDVVFDFFVDTPGRGRAGAAVTPAFDEVSVDFGAAVQRFHCGPGSVAVPGALAGIGFGALAQLVSVALVVAAIGIVRGTTAAAAIALITYFTLPLLDLVSALERWSPVRLQEAFSQLGSGAAHPIDFVRPAISALALIAGSFVVGVHGLRRREP